MAYMLAFFVLSFFAPLTEPCFNNQAPSGYPEWQYKTRLVQDCWNYYAYGDPRCMIKEEKQLKHTHFDPRTGEEYSEPVGKWLMRNVFTTVMPTLPSGYRHPPATAPPRYPPSLGVGVTSVTAWPGIDIGTEGDYLLPFSRPKPTTPQPLIVPQSDGQYLYENQGDHGAAPISPQFQSDYFSLDETTGQQVPMAPQGAPVAYPQPSPGSFQWLAWSRLQQANSSKENSSLWVEIPDNVTLVDNSNDDERILTPSRHFYVPKNPEKVGIVRPKKRRPVLIGVLANNGTEFIVNDTAAFNHTRQLATNASSVRLVQVVGPKGPRLVVIPTSGRRRKFNLTVHKLMANQTTTVKT